MIIIFNKTIWLYLILFIAYTHFLDVQVLCFLEVLKFSRIPRISSLLANTDGVFPEIFVELGLSVKGAKILIISVCPYYAALWIGVFPYLSGALGLSVKGAKILTISISPLQAAQ